MACKSPMLLLVLGLALLVSSGAMARDWFVATNGNDGNDGTIGYPLARVETALENASAGDVVQVRSGNYTGQIWPDPIVGSPTAYITVRSYDGALTATLNTAVGLENCAYLRFEDIDFYVSNAHCVNVYTFTYGQCHHIDFLRCRFRERDTDGSAGGDELVKAATMQYMLFEDCEIYVEDGTYTTTSFAMDLMWADYTTVRRAYFHDFNGAGFYVKGGSQYCVLEQSVISTARDTYGMCVKTGDGSVPWNPNSVYDCEYLVLRNNIMRNTPQAAIYVQNIQWEYIYNNLFADTGGPARPTIANHSAYNPAEHQNGRADHIRIYNNIFLDTVGDISAVYGHDVGEATDWVHGNNNFYNNGNPIPVGNLTVDGVAVDPNTETGKTIGNPSLSNPTGTATTRQGWINLYRPNWDSQSNTMLKDKGSSTAGNNPLPSVMRDIEGLPRPCDSGWDIGPYEYQGVLPLPVADFTGAPTQGTPPLTVQFTDSSSAAPTSWSWSFGDSSTSTAQNPSHQYNSLGNFTVSLTATNSTGPDTETKTNYISVTALVADFSATPTGGGVPLAVTFADLSTNSPTSWSWTFGDGGTSTVQNPSHTYTNQGYYTVSLIATKATGSDTETKVDYITACTLVYAYPTTYTTGLQLVSGSLTNLQANDGSCMVLRQSAGGGGFGINLQSDTSYTPNEVYALGYDIKLRSTSATDPACTAVLYRRQDDTWADPECPWHPLGNTFQTRNHEQVGGVAGFMSADGIVGIMPYDYNAATTGPFDIEVDWVRFRLYLYPTGTPQPPVANFSGSPTSGAAPLAVSFTDLSTNTPTAWSWTFGDSTTSTVQHPSHTYSSTGNYSVTLTATNNGGSDGETKTNYIAVGNPPVAAFSGTPTTGTAPLSVSFTDSSTNTPTAWSWVFGDSSTSTAQNPSHSYAAGTFTVALTATNAYGSDGETKSNYISVTPPAPVANFTGTPTTGTAPLAVSFTDTSTNTPTAWSWNFGDSTTSTVQSPSHTYTNSGNYTVSLRATNAGGYDDEVKTNCIAVTSGGGSVPTFVAAGAVSSGTGTITPALPAGLATNDLLLLFVETANQASSITNQNGGTWTVVTGSPQSYGTAAAANAVRLTAFWSRYNGTQGNPTVNDSGNHQLGRIIAIRGVTPSGDPWDVTAGGTESTADTSGSIPGATTTVANTLVVTALATSLPDAAGTANFSAWTNADLSSLTERTDNTVTAGNGGGLSVATGGKATAGAYAATAVTCGTASTKALLSIALKPAGSAPVANFSGTPTTGTAPLLVSFTDSSTNTPTAWSWAFGDSNTSTAQSPSHSYAAGTFTVTLTATNAYGSDGETKSNYITVSAPSLEFVPASHNIINGSLDPGSPTDFEVLRTDNQQAMIYNEGAYWLRMRYYYQTGYTPAQVSNILVEVQLRSTYAATPQYALSVRGVGDVGGRSLVGWTIPGTTDTWFTGNITSGEMSTYLSSGGEFILELCACGQNYDHYQTLIDVARITLTTTGGGSAPVANFSGTPTLGAAPLVVTFTDSSTNAPTAWSWSFGDSNTSTAQNPSHSYAAGTFTVTLTATNAYGSDGETKNNYITADNPPVANFSGTPTTGAAPLAVTFTDSSTNAPTAWSWSFGDSNTSTAQNPSHSYAAGAFTVTLTATNAYGSDGETKNSYITAGNPPVANFSGTPTTGTAPLAVSFTDTSTNTPTAWSWTFGDSTISTVQNPSHTYAAGMFTVTLTATNAYGSDGETKNNYISVTPPAPVASFSGTPTTGTAPLAVSFTDTSTNTPTAWSWTFGDSTTSTVQNPSHTYAAGTFTVTLTATNAGGSDGETKNNYITVTPPAPVANFSGTPTTGTAPLAVTFTDTSTNTPTAWSWTFGDSTTSTVQNPSHTYAVGTFTVTLTATNAGGSDGETKNNYISVTPPAPVANFSGTPTSGKASLAVTFTDNSTNTPTAWSWSFGDSTTSTAQNPSHTYTTSAYYTVSLTATNAGGSDGETKNNYITVYNEVTLYPTTWETPIAGAIVTLVSGMLADLQSDNGTYMVYRSDASSDSSSIRWKLTPGYSPSQIYKMVLDVQWKGSLSTTPTYNLAIWMSSGTTWAEPANWELWPTTDTTETWETYTSGDYFYNNQLWVDLCGCPQNGSTYDTSVDLVRWKLWLLP